MSRSRPVVVLSCAILALASYSVSAQQTISPIKRDAQALILLQQSLVAMGGTVPADSVASGTVTIVAGSKTDTGTIRILSRGAGQTSERTTIDGVSRGIVYSMGSASESDGTTTKELQLELAVTSQSPDFPILLLATILADGDSAFEYIGQETLDSVAVSHLRIWKTFPSKPKLQHLAEFSLRDVWIDAKSALPKKLSYHRRGSRGPEYPVLMEVFYSDFRSISGVLFPYRIEKSRNGTPWTTIVITNVAFNTGLTAAEFATEQGEKP